MNVKIEVDFEDNMTYKEGITELRRGPAVQNRNEIYGGPYDNHAAVQPSCTTSKQNLIKIPEIQLPCPLSVVRFGIRLHIMRAAKG